MYNKFAKVMMGLENNILLYELYKDKRRNDFERKPCDKFMLTVKATVEKTDIK